jgi:hypothetical protein
MNIFSPLYPYCLFYEDNGRYSWTLYHTENLRSLLNCLGINEKGIVQAVHFISSTPQGFITLQVHFFHHPQGVNIYQYSIKKAQDARGAVGGYVCIAAPDFGDLAPNKDASDWNDLVRIKGREIAKAQIALVVKINE